MIPLFAYSILQIILALNCTGVDTSCTYYPFECLQIVSYHHHLRCPFFLKFHTDNFSQVGALPTLSLSLGRSLPNNFDTHPLGRCTYRPLDLRRVAPLQRRQMQLDMHTSRYTHSISGSRDTELEDLRLKHNVRHITNAAAR